MQADLGSEAIPVNIEPCKADLILCNYVMCFLTDDERIHLSKEINRVSNIGAHLILEMYEAKQGVPYNMIDIRSLFESWEIIHSEKDRFIVTLTENPRL